MKFSATAKTALLSCIAVLFLTGCSVFTDEQNIRPDLNGSWEWISSTGGIGGWTVHRDSVNYRQQLKIDDFGAARWFRADTLLNSYQVERNSDNNIRADYVLVPENEQIRIWIDNRSGTDTLFLQDNCDDCFSHIFIRDRLNKPSAN